MAQVDLSLGLGVQDVRTVFVFHSRAAFGRFVEQGWEFGGQAGAAAKSESEGGSVTGEVSISPRSMYTLTGSGLVAKVNLAGTKYWKDEGLNAC